MARCAQASAGAPVGRDEACSGTSTTVDSVTVARSAAGVISIEALARADTCPYAVTSPSRDSTRAASTRSLRCLGAEVINGSPVLPDERLVLKLYTLLRRRVKRRDLREGEAP